MNRYKLGDICEIVSGSTPKTGVAEYWDGDVKWITPAELNDESYIINDSVRKITRQAVRETSLTPFPAGTVILSSRAPIGKVAIAGCEMYCNQGFKNLICSEKINNRYLYWFLKGNTEYLNSLGRGATFKEISKQIVSDIEINVPDISRQKEVVCQLEKVSEIIQLRKQELQKLDELLKARFVELFDSGSWDTVRAGSIMYDMRNGISPSNKGSHPARVLTLSAITQGAFDAEAWKDGLFDSDPPKEKRVVSSDFYMCRGNGNKELVGAGVYSAEDRYDLVFPDTVIAACIDQQRICLPYLCQAWKQPSVRKQIEQGARTTNGTYKINQGVVANVEIKLPPRELQEQFAAFAAQVDKSKEVVQKALDEAQTLFYSLMQEYFG